MLTTGCYTRGMIKTHWLLAAAALSACNVSSSNEVATEPTAAAEAAAQKVPDVPIVADTSFLSDEEKQVVNLLMQASDLMSPIYLRQSAANNPAIRDQIAATGDKALLARFDANMGPWDEFEDGKPFFGNTPKPAGAGFYPADLTKAQFEAYLAAHPAEKAVLTDPYTVVQRQGGRLVAIPYNDAYKQWLEPAAKLMEKAAAITTNPSLKNFLTLRAKAFRTNDYYESELAWMDLKDTPIEFVIGPYETYTDGLMGLKTAFEAYVVLRNPKESQALDVYTSHLRDMEANLPVDEKYKNFKRGFESPISVGAQIRGGGDNLHGAPSIAFNLPNDERVREAKGAKKVILENLVDAKFDKITGPMAALVLVPEQAKLANKRYMTLNTVFHEMSHSLGPGSINVNGRATSVSAELKEEASGIEEAKADMLGVWDILYMMKNGLLPAAEREQSYASYVVDLFRHMRFGTTEAHARGSAMQYRYLADRGAIVWDPQAKRFRIDVARMEPALGALIGDVVRLQGDGNYAGTKAFMTKWSAIDPNAKQVIGTMTSLPVDIHPIYPSQVN
ncbi:MAG: dipeptidyl-peptidase 3 family protein [Sphingomicrobium sp.]